MELYAEPENLTSSGWVKKWVKRKSGASYVVMATLVGVIVAAVLGMIGVAVGFWWPISNGSTLFRNRHHTLGVLIVVIKSIVQYEYILDRCFFKQSTPLDPNNA